MNCTYYKMNNAEELIKKFYNQYLLSRISFIPHFRYVKLFIWPLYHVFRLLSIRYLEHSPLSTWLQGWLYPYIIIGPRSFRKEFECNLLHIFVLLVPNFLWFGCTLYDHGILLMFIPCTSPPLCSISSCCRKIQT